MLRTPCGISVRREKRRSTPTPQADKFKCDLCHVFLNFAETKKAHRNGKKHLARVRHVKDGQQVCTYCNVAVRTKKEFENHLNSRRHKSISKNKYRLLDSANYIRLLDS